MRLFIKERESGLKLPQRANETDAGYDIFADSDPLVTGLTANGNEVKDWAPDACAWLRIDFVQYKTGLFWAQSREPLGIDIGGVIFDDKRKHIELFPRSSASKYNLSLCNCVPTIDHGYRGEVLLRFNYLWQPEDFIVSGTGKMTVVGFVNLNKIYKKGDAIVQMKPRIDEEIEFILVKELNQTDRGDGGFGSSDAKRGL